MLGWGFWDRQDRDQQSQFNDYHSRVLTNQESRCLGVNSFWKLSIDHLHTMLHPKVGHWAQAQQKKSTQLSSDLKSRVFSLLFSVFSCESAWRQLWFCWASSSCWRPPLLQKVSLLGILLGYLFSVFNTLYFSVYDHSVGLYLQVSESGFVLQHHKEAHKHNHAKNVLYLEVQCSEFWELC